MSDIVLPGFFLLVDTMSFPLTKTPKSVNARIWYNNGWFYILRRFGSEGCWESVGRFKEKDSAYARLEYEIGLSNWAKEVKIKAGWVCGRCGELDKTLLEAHHIKPKSECIKGLLDINNGRCLCVWCHAIAHWLNKAVRTIILARYAVIIGIRLHPKDKDRNITTRFVPDRYAKPTDKKADPSLYPSGSQR